MAARSRSSSNPYGDALGGGRSGAVASSRPKPAPRAPSNSEPAQRKTLASERLNPNKFASPFASNSRKCKSTFSESYISGSIPCRLQTTASRFYLKWDDGAEAGFSPDLLVVCADGLVESEHPYAVMAPMMFLELCLRSQGCADMFSAEVLSTVCAHIRSALTQGLAAPTAGKPGGPPRPAAIGKQTSVNTIFGNALGALEALMQQAGMLVLPHLAKIIPVLSRPFGSTDKALKERVAKTLMAMEDACGVEASKLIKAKIPTF